MRRERAVLFDVGGTLLHVDGERVCLRAGLSWSAASYADAERRATDAVRAWVRRHPVSTDRERLSGFLGAMLVGLGVPEAGRAGAVERVLSEHDRANLWSRPDAHAAPTLDRLRERGYRLGAVSNADGRVRALLESTGLAGRLEIVVDSAELGIEKPDPRIFAAALESLGVPASESAYVGDIFEIDVLGAKAAGMRPILLGSSPAPEPVERVRSLPELLGLFPDRAAC